MPFGLEGTVVKNGGSGNPEVLANISIRDLSCRGRGDITISKRALRLMPSKRVGLACNEKIEQDQGFGETTEITRLRD